MDPGIKFEPLGKGIGVAVSKEHTFGTDAILLANFCAAKNGDDMVDLGTGCGIIPFIVMRDKKLKSCVGVDISERAVELASIGAKKNGFDSFKAICADITDLKGKISFGNHTLVTFNPPYKAAGAGIKSKNPTVRAARHEISGDMEAFVKTAARLLQTSGRLVMCQRPERAAELITLMSNSGIEPKRMRAVAKCVGERPWLVMVEGRRCAAVGLTIEPTLYIQDGEGNYSKEMIDIYGDYKQEYL